MTVPQRCQARLKHLAHTPRRTASSCETAGAYRLGDRTVHLRRPSIIEIRDTVGLLNTLPVSFEAETAAAMLIDGALSTNNFAGLTDWLRHWVEEQDFCELWLLEANAGQLTVLIEDAILALVEMAWFRRHLASLRENYRRTVKG